MVAKKSNRQQLLWHTCVIDEFLMFNATSFHKIFQEGLLLFPLVAEAGYWTSKPSTWQKQSLKSCPGYYLMMVKEKHWFTVNPPLTVGEIFQPAALHFIWQFILCVLLSYSQEHLEWSKINHQLNNHHLPTSYHTPLKINILIITPPPPKKIKKSKNKKN